MGQALLVCVVVIGWGTVRSFHGGAAWPLIVGFVALAVLIPIHLGLQGKMARGQRLVDFYDRGLERVRGEKTQSGNTGIGCARTGICMSGI